VAPATPAAPSTVGAAIPAAPSTTTAPPNPLASLPGAVTGTTQTPEAKAQSEGIGKAYGDQAAQIIEAGGKAPDAIGKVEALQNAALQYRTGTTGDARLAGQKALIDGLQAIGVTPPDWLTNSTAAGEAISKIGGSLTAEMTRSLGSREAASIFNSIRNYLPNVSMSQGGFDIVLNSLRQGAMRDQDLANFQDNWLTSHSSISGMRTAFEKSNPIEAYSSRVIPFPLPSSAAQAVPNVVYNTAKGPALWDGTKFTPLR